MDYFYSCHTDIGTTREVNQDTLIIKDFTLFGKRVLLAAVCDGVGGLSGGEKASRRTAELLSDWFDYELPQILGKGREETTILNRWEQLISDINKEIFRQGSLASASQGTTMTMILLWNYRYFIGHVGDSRVYGISDQVRQLTRDHTWVAREVELGHMTKEEALHDSRQNIVLQCVGADPYIKPEIYSGEIRGQITFLLCSDGFWHYAANSEMKIYFAPGVLNDENKIQRNLAWMIEQVKQRGETDNITAIAVKVF